MQSPLWRDIELALSSICRQIDNGEVEPRYVRGELSLALAKLSQLKNQMDPPYEHESEGKSQ